MANGRSAYDFYLEVHPGWQQVITHGEGKETGEDIEAETSREGEDGRMFMAPLIWEPTTVAFW